MNARTAELAALRDEVAKAKFAETNQQARAMQIEEELLRVREAAAAKEREEDAAFREALPFLFEHVNYLKDQCRKPYDKRRPYPDHCPYESSRIHWRYCYLLCSSVGEHQSGYLVKTLGFPSWRTIQRCRQEPLDQVGLKDDLFDGWEENLARLIRLIRQVLQGTGHPQYMEGSVACHPIAASSGVSVAEDGTVTG
jgi:hypothetical protein